MIHNGCAKCGEDYVKMTEKNDKQAYTGEIIIDLVNSACSTVSAIGTPPTYRIKYF